MWVSRHGFILGAVLMIGGLFAGFWFAELTDGRLPWPRGSLGFVGAGGAMAAGDVTLRAVWGQGPFMPRYLSARTGPNLRHIPAWMVGALLIALGVSLR